MADKGKRQSTRKTVNDELDLGYPLEAFRPLEAPRNEHVLLHIIHHIRSGTKGHSSFADVLPAVLESLKASWQGSNVKLACDSALRKRLVALNELYR